jgi:thioredoxin 1
MKGCTVDSTESFTQLDQFDFHHRMADLTGLAIVIFTGPACGSCHAWKELLARFGGLREALTLFEVDIERDAALAAEFSVFHLPALFLYRDGQFHAPIQCEATMSALTEAVNKLLSEPAQEIP